MSLLTDSLMNVLNSLKSAIQMPKMISAYSMADSHFLDCGSNCSGACSYQCGAHCAGMCEGTCVSACAGNCMGGCKGACAGRCIGGCVHSCEG